MLTLYKHSSWGTKNITNYKISHKIKTARDAFIQIILFCDISYIFCILICEKSSKFSGNSPMFKPISVIILILLFFSVFGSTNGKCWNRLTIHAKYCTLFEKRHKLKISSVVANRQFWVHYNELVKLFEQASESHQFCFN